MRTWDDPNCEFLISYDTANKKLSRLTDEEKVSYSGEIREFEHCARDEGGVVPAWNRLAKAATGDVLQVISDDLELRTPNWRDILLEIQPNFTIEPWSFVGDDLLRIRGKTTWERKLAGHPCLSRQYYELFGYVWNPIYKHFYCDDEFYEVGTRIGRLLYIPEIIHENMHWSENKSPKDQWSNVLDPTIVSGKQAFKNKNRINNIVQAIKKKL